MLFFWEIADFFYGMSSARQRTRRRQTRPRERRRKGVKWGSSPSSPPFQKSGGEQSAQSDSFNLVPRERAIKHLQENLLLFPSFSRLIISHLCFA